MPAPRKPWIARHTIICSIDEVKPHIRLAKVKPAAEIANSDAGAERARQEAGQRDRDHFGDQIGGLHP